MPGCPNFSLDLELDLFEGIDVAGIDVNVFDDPDFLDGFSTEDPVFDAHDYDLALSRANIEHEDSYIRSFYNRELILQGLNLLRIYQRVQTRGRGRPSDEVRVQQRRRLRVLENNLEALR
jgi:hypothetical protein